MFNEVRQFCRIEGRPWWWRFASKIPPGWFLPVSDSSYHVLALTQGDSDKKFVPPLPESSKRWGPKCGTGNGEKEKVFTVF